MTKYEMLQWISQEFLPVTLATPDETVYQIIDNAIRYWNTHSAFPLVRMFDTLPANDRIQLSPDYKNVTHVYPAANPDWILQNYPLWSLLGITIIDNLTSDLILLSEAYRNYKYYIGTDFHFKYMKSDNPAIGGYLYLNNLPSGASSICVVGTKRIINGSTQEAITGTSGTLSFYPLEERSISITDGVQTYTDIDDGDGVLESSVSGYSGTIDYTTGAWTVTGWDADSTTGTASYVYEEDIKSEYLLNWLLYYIKALVQIVEGNTLRKASSIGITNDGNNLMSEGREAKKELEKQLAVEGRWVGFCKRF